MAMPALLIPVIIMGGILFGWFTPTEAAAVAVVYALVVPPIFYRAAVAEGPAGYLRRLRAPLRRHRPDHRFRRRLRLGLVLFQVPLSWLTAIAAIAPSWWLFILS